MASTCALQATGVRKDPVTSSSNPALLECTTMRKAKALAKCAQPELSVLAPLSTQCLVLLAFTAKKVKTTTPAMQTTSLTPAKKALMED